MKNSLTLILIATLTILSSCSNSITTKKPEELKVLVWNIWHGGHSKEYPEKGCEGVLGILKKSDADIILMIETYGASAKVADHLGYYHRLLSSNLSIYSRYHITKTYTFSEIATFNFGGVEIDMNGQKIRLFDTWLSYLPGLGRIPTDKSEAEILAWDNAGSRDDEIRKILNLLKPFIAEADSIPIIMGGDFNSPSHLDWTEATKDLASHNHDGAVVNWTVTKEMEKVGFKDSFREINTDLVKDIGSTIGKGRDHNFRIDYIFYKGKTIQALESETYHENLGETLSLYDEDFFYASDHGFVLTSFEIKPFKQ